MTDSRRSRLLLAAAIAAFAAVWVLVCGSSRFTHSTTLAYVGGFEIVSGRWPYRDFFFVAGPVLFVMQALFAKLAGPGYWSALIHSAVFNAVAALLAFDIVRRRSRDLSWAAAAGLLTAVWFYPIYYEMPWYNTESFFFLFIAVWLLEAGGGRRAALSAAGVCAALAFYTKQSNGAIGMALLGLYALSARGWGPAAVYAAGAAAGLLGLGGLFAWLAGEPALFWHHFMVVPLSSRYASFSRDPRFWAVGLALAAALLAYRRAGRLRWFAAPAAFLVGAVAATSPYYLVFLAPLAALRWLGASEAGLLVCALSLAQLGGRIISDNEIKVFWPFLGVLFGLAAPAFPWGRLWAWAGWAFLAAWGLRLSYGHQVYALVPGTTFLAAAFAGALALLSWRERRRAAALALTAAALALAARGSLVYFSKRADPAAVEMARRSRATARSAHPHLRGIAMTESEARFIDSVLDYVSSLGPERRPVLFYRCELFYPLIGQTTPHSLLEFSPNFTFRKGDGTERRVLADLERARPRTVVECLEPLFEDMPVLQEWAARRGRVEREGPGFRGYEIVW